MKIGSIKRVMVRAPNWVGDAVMAVPALGEIRRIFADAHITLVAKPWVAGLFEGEGLCDEMLLLEDGPRSHGLSGFIATARRLKSTPFDLAILLQNAIGAALLAKAARITTIAGYPTDGRRLLLDIVVPFLPNRGKTHQVIYYLNIPAALEREFAAESRVSFEKPFPCLHLSEDERRAGTSLLVDSGIAADGPVAIINPGATNSRAKMWPAERFAEVADRFAHQDGFRIAIIGAPGDEAVAAETGARMNSRAAVLAGRTSIAQLKAVLGCASLVVSNDTGAAHVSAALGIPTVVVFGPTEHVSTRPLSDRAAVVRHDVYCSPCMLRECPIDHRCMAGVSVSDVYTAARQLMAMTSDG